MATGRRGRRRKIRIRSITLCSPALTTLRRPVFSPRGQPILPSLSLSRTTLDIGRSIMRTLLALLAVASGFSVLAERADARKPPRAQMQTQKNDANTAPPARARDSSQDAVRAASVDPAGNYKAFPDWARAAFGGRNPGSGR